MTCQEQDEARQYAHAAPERKAYGEGEEDVPQVARHDVGA